MGIFQILPEHTANYSLKHLISNTIFFWSQKVPSLSVSFDPETSGRGSTINLRSDLRMVMQWASRWETGL
jgi:hypothetical protein